MSECKPFGEGELEFNQNTVPFDFDGARLMWLTYKDKNVRELSIFHFNEARSESVHNFSPSYGMVSHLKFLKTEFGTGKYVFYVKDTIHLVMFNIEDKSSVLIGQTQDAILAMNVDTMTLRQKDIEQLQGTD